MTLIDKVFEYIREHPTDTPTEIGKALDIQRGHASTYIERLVEKGNIKIDYVDGKKTYVFLKERDSAIKSLAIAEQAHFKRDIYQKMLNTYIEDFEGATGFNERVEIGKLILRLLEKI